MNEDDDLPTVSVWEFTGAHWSLVGSVARYESLSFTPKFNDPGDWEVTLPFDSLAEKFHNDRVFSVDWRGVRSTWVIDDSKVTSDGRGKNLTVGGYGALGMLGWELAWPDPTKGLGSQPEPPVAVSGSCEDVIKALVDTNWLARRAATLTIPLSTGLGAPRKAKPRFDNLLDVVLAKAGLDGLGVDVTLVNLTPSTAELQLRVWQPADLSRRVHLAESVGTIGGWSQNESGPKVTKALVGGAGVGVDRVFQVVTTDESVAEAQAFGGHRVVFVNGPTSYDDADLIEAGEEALEGGAQTTNVNLTALDATGLRAFTHYDRGDLVTGELASGVGIVDNISSIKVDVTTSNGAVVTPTFGDPDSDDAQISQAQLIAALMRRIKKVEASAQATPIPDPDPPPTS